MNHIPRHILPLMLVAFAGCATHPVDTQPTPLIDLPADADLESESIFDGPWWHALETAELDPLITTAMTENLSLGQGLARIQASEALLRQARALERPTLDLQGNAERRFERTLRRPDRDDSEEQRNGGTANGDGDAGDAGDAPPRSSSSRGSDEADRNSWETAYELGLQFQWELDFWGRLANLSRAEASRFQASLADQEALRLLISAQVADAYFSAIEQRLQLALLDEQLASAEAFEELIELRFLQGGASSVDLLQQQSQVAEIRSEIPVARAQLALFENRLDTLLGQPADGIARTDRSELALPEESYLRNFAVPLRALLRRPDIHAARQRVVAADYEIAVAVAERLPRITLDGSLLLGGAGDITNLNAAGGMGLFQPLLDWGRRRAAVDVARANWLEDLLAFSEVYLIAIEEVLSTLAEEQEQQHRIRALVEREAILQRTLEQTRLRYSQGVSDYLPVLTAQQELQEIQRTILQERRVLVALQVQYFRAIGAPTTARQDFNSLTANDEGARP